MLSQQLPLCLHLITGSQRNTLAQSGIRHAGDNGGCGSAADACLRAKGSPSVVSCEDACPVEGIDPAGIDFTFCNIRDLLDIINGGKSRGRQGCRHDVGKVTALDGRIIIRKIPSQDAVFL